MKKIILGILITSIFSLNSFANVSNISPLNEKKSFDEYQNSVDKILKNYTKNYDNISKLIFYKKLNIALKSVENNPKYENQIDKIKSIGFVAENSVDYENVLIDGNNAYVFEIDNSNSGTREHEGIFYSRQSLFLVNLENYRTKELISDVYRSNSTNYVFYKGLFDENLIFLSKANNLERFNILKPSYVLNLKDLKISETKIGKEILGFNTSFDENKILYINSLQEGKGKETLGICDLILDNCQEITTTSENETFDQTSASYIGGIVGRPKITINSDKKELYYTTYTVDKSVNGNYEFLQQKVFSY